VLDEGRKTVLVGVGPTDMQAVDVGGPATNDSTPSNKSIEVVPDSILKRRPKYPERFDNLRDIVFLSKQGSNAVYWSEKIGSSVMLYCLTGRESIVSTV